jgi:hypothetical protein
MQIPWLDNPKLSLQVKEEVNDLSLPFTTCLTSHAESGQSTCNTRRCSVLGGGNTIGAYIMRLIKARPKLFQVEHLPQSRVICFT